MHNCLQHSVWLLPANVTSLDLVVLLSPLLPVMKTASSGDHLTRGEKKTALFPVLHVTTPGTLHHMYCFEK